MISTDRFIRALWKPGDVREVRIPKYDGFKTAAGYFDNPELLVGQVDTWDGKGNVYITLNPVKPALLARAANRIAPVMKTTTSDLDITRRAELLIDIDPVRPAGISSTKAEANAARVSALAVRGYLNELGWPQPMIGMSGNGYALLYAIDLPNDPNSTALVAGILAHLAVKFDSDTVKIDTSVSNAARIACLFGTMKVKGDNTPDRPHRRSEIAVPGLVDTVPVELLTGLLPANGHALATTSPRKLRQWLDAAGVRYRERPPDARGIVWYRLEVCPAHPDDDIGGDCAVGEGSDGKLAGKCFHARGADWHWSDFRQALQLGPAEPKADTGRKDRKATPRFYTPTELVKLTLPTPDWLIPGYLAIAAITEIDGKIKAAGKTTLSLHKVRAVLDGAPFLDRPTRRARVVYVSEQSRQTFTDALRRAGLADRGDELRILFRDDLRGMKWPEVVELVHQECVTGNRELVVIDTIGKLAGIVNENDAGEWSQAMNPVLDLRDSGRAVLLDRHDRKSGGEVGESGRGSSQASGDADIVLALRRPEGNQPSSRRVIEALSRYPDTPDKIVIELGTDGYQLLGTIEAVGTSDARLMLLSALGREFRQHETGASQADLVELGEARVPKVKRWAVLQELAALVNHGKVKVTGKARSKTTPLRYWPSDVVVETPTNGVPTTPSDGDVDLAFTDDEKASIYRSQRTDTSDTPVSRTPDTKKEDQRMSNPFEPDADRFEREAEQRIEAQRKAYRKGTGISQFGGDRSYQEPELPPARIRKRWSEADDDALEKQLNDAFTPKPEATKPPRRIHRREVN